MVRSEEVSRARDIVRGDGLVEVVGQGLAEGLVELEVARVEEFTHLS